MDIFAYLKDDHGKQRGLSAGLLDTSGDSAERRRLFDALLREVEAHAAAEEQTLYSELIAHEEGQEKARHSIAEHQEAATLLTELGELDMSSGGWLNKFKRFQEDLEHHLAEEEEEVFELAGRLFGEEKADELGQAFDKAKQQQLSK
ncbi:MAG: hemerythrin domain-containing protein [Rhodospirillales bacterium]